MGDRHNVGIVMEGGDILWFYSHWGFRTGPAATVAAAVQNAAGRWDDQSYCRRILLSNLLESALGGSGFDSETGAGLSLNTIGDNEHSLFVIDVDGQTVSLYPEWDGHRMTIPAAKYTMGYEPFIRKYLK